MPAQTERLRRFLLIYGGNMENTGKLRNMTSVYLLQGGKMLLLYRQGSRVVNQVWIGSAGGIADGKKVVFTKMPAF